MASKLKLLAAAMATVGLLAACGGGGGADTTPKAKVTSVKVMGDSLADSGTFGFKFTVQGSAPTGAGSTMIWPERIADQFSQSLCAHFRAGDENLTTYQEVATCTNYAVGGGRVNPLDAPTSPKSVLVQIQVASKAGFSADDLVVIDQTTGVLFAGGLVFADRVRLKQVLHDHPHLQAADQSRRLLYESIRRMLSAQVYDVIATTQANIAAAGVASVQDVRQSGQRLVAFSPSMHYNSQALKTFLLHHLYRHPQVMQTMNHAQQMVKELFAAYMLEPERMKPRFVQRAHLADTLHERARVVADFVAGMTDRYAAHEHERITGVRLLAQD